MNNKPKTRKQPEGVSAETVQYMPQTSSAKSGESERRDALYRLLVESSDDAIYLVDRECKYLYMNRRHQERLGLSGEEVAGLQYSRFHSLSETRYFVCKVNEVVRTGKSAHHVHRSLRDGRYFLRTLSPIMGQGGEIEAVSVISKDISQLKMTEKRLHSLSVTDELTGLLNRRGFLSLAGQQVKISHRLKKGMSLLSADLDDLKKINDTFGHQEGDGAIIETATILRESFRKADIIARIGGDEFVVLLIEPAYDDPDVYASRVRRILEIHNAENNRGYRLSLSLGMASCDPDSSYSIHDLIAEADKLMYEQKRKKKRSKVQAGPLTCHGEMRADHSLSCRENDFFVLA